MTFGGLKLSIKIKQPGVAESIILDNERIKPGLLIIQVSKELTMGYMGMQVWRKRF